MFTEHKFGERCTNEQEFHERDSVLELTESSPFMVHVHVANAIRMDRVAHAHSKFEVAHITHHQRQTKIKMTTHMGLK